MSLIGELGHGGSERQLFLTAREMTRQGTSSEVVVFNKSDYPAHNDALREAGVTVHEVPETMHSVAARSRFIYSLLRNTRPHVVHSWTAHDNPYAGVIGKLARVPVAIGSVRGSFATSQLTSLQRKAAVRSVRGIVVNSQALRSELVEMGIGERRITVMPNCVEAAAPPHSRRDIRMFDDLGITDDQPVVGIVGNLRRFKNHLMFVEAIARVVEALPDPKLRAVIVGQPIPYELQVKVEIESAIDRHGLRETVAMVGFQPDVPTLMHGLDIFCSTSDQRGEGMPNVVLEAMAAGRPLIATRAAGVVDMITDGSEGLLVEPGDAGAMARGIERLLKDRALAERLGAAAHRRAVAEFGCGTAAARMTEMYRKALDGRPFWRAGAA